MDIGFLFAIVLMVNIYAKTGPMLAPFTMRVKSIISVALT